MVTELISRKISTKYVQEDVVCRRSGHNSRKQTSTTGSVGGMEGGVREARTEYEHGEDTREGMVTEDGYSEAEVRCRTQAGTNACRKVEGVMIDRQISEKTERKSPENVCYTSMPVWSGDGGQKKDERPEERGWDAMQPNRKIVANQADMGRLIIAVATFGHDVTEFTIYRQRT